ncbi:MAG TPA: helix-turn-helix domain-containing protein, partial [Acidimicrobiales bacterium]|nr:helix-turn-helix domain-containing protein [Acidimicrobiales bacterium]
RMTDDVERRRRQDMLRSLLEGRVPAGVAGPPLGIDPLAPCTVVAFALGTRDAGEALIKSERAVDLVSLYGEAFRRQASCVAMGSTVYLLVPDESDVRRLSALASDVIERTEGALRVPMRAGIGSTVPRLDDVAVSRREADQVLRSSGEPVTHVEEVRSRIVLLELADLARGQAQLQAGPLAALQAHDEAKGTCYVETLRAWLEAFGDVPSAAASISVHPNTFRYRLRRLVELSGIDLDDADERLVAALQLRLAP